MPGDRDLEYQARKKPLLVCVKNKNGLAVGIPPLLREYRDPIFDLPRKEVEVVVEIGSLQGWFAWRLSKFFPEAKIFSVDRFDSGEYGSGSYNQKCWKNNLAGRSNAELIVADSDVVARSWDLGIDFLFIDGDHSYEGVLSDLRSWVPHVNPGGLVSGHDIDGKWGPNVKRALEEYCPTIGINEIHVSECYSFTGVQVTPCWWFYR